MFLLPRKTVSDSSLPDVNLLLFFAGQFLVSQIAVDIRTKIAAYFATHG